MNVEQRFTLEWSQYDPTQDFSRRTYALYRCVTCGAAVSFVGRDVHHVWHLNLERHLEIDPEEPAETGGVVQ
jgi:hypothetical protein